MKRNVLYSSIYILRAWRDGDDHDATPWRFTVEDTATGARHGFTRLVDLIGFIETDAEATLSTKAEQVSRTSLQ